MKSDMKERFALEIGMQIIEACNPIVFKIDGFIPDPDMEYRFKLVCSIVGKINRTNKEESKENEKDNGSTGTVSSSSDANNDNSAD